MNDNREPSPTLPRVLIVDDSRMVRAIIGKHIRSAFDVREEVDGEAGWGALLLDPTIQVVVTDHSMPKLDGYGLIERIRSSKISRLRALPIIMISGDEDEAVRIRAKELGATDFITKGIGTPELLSRLETVVRLAQTNHALQEARDQSLIDQDSGLLSRAFLLRQGEQAMSLAKRHGWQISTFVIGVDQAERLTQQFGYDFHERVLQQFARILSGSIRREDTLARWSDGLLAIFSANTTLQASKVFAARVCKAVEAAAIRHGTEVLHLSVSIGLANNLADRLESSTALLDLAEQRMRSAATTGGNRVVGASDAVVGVNASAPLLEQVGERASEYTIDQAIASIARGDVNSVRTQLPALARRLLPLLRVLDAEYSLGMPMTKIEEAFQQQAHRQSFGNTIN